MSDTDRPDENGNVADDDQPDVLGTLSETAQRFIDDPDIDTAQGRDLPDDASGEEPPQDGDPAR
jgi:hypothetical protein